MNYEAEDVFETSPISPEKILLLQVLLRAVRDLEDGNRTVRSAAIVWFSMWENYMSYGVGISYKDVREHIDLTPSQLAHIQQLMTQASKRNYASLKKVA